MADADWMRRATGGSPRRFALALLAVLLGAWAASALTIGTIASATIKSGPPEVPWLVVLSYSILLLPRAALPILAIGAGVHLVLVAFRARRWAAYAAAGTIAGLVFGIPWFPCPYGLHGMACVQGGLRNWISFAAMPGLGGALAFWAVLRPDRWRAERSAINS